MAANRPVSAVAFRAKHLAPDVMGYLAGAQRSRLSLLFTLPLLILVGVLVGRLSLSYALPLAGAVAAGLAIWGYVTKGGTLRGVVLAPLIVIVGLLFCRLSAVFLANQTLATAALALGALAAFVLYGQRPLDLCTAWSGAIVPGAEMAASTIRFGSTRRSTWILATALAIVVVVPARHSTTLAIVLLLLFLAGVVLLYCARAGGLPHRILPALMDDAKWIDTLYFGYPDHSTLQTGVWSPTDSLARRRSLYALQTVPLYLAFLVGLSLCCPWEIFAAWATPGYRWTVPAQAPTSDFDWLVGPLKLMFRSHPVYLWSLLIAIPLLVVLVPTVRFVCILPALLEARKPTAVTPPATAVREAPVTAPAPASDDPFDLGDLDTPRTQWDEIVDRIRLSKVEHEISPGKFIKEADHVYFGSYTATGAPAFIHRAVIEEHGYVVGQTGSGKTALGLIPLVTQLIRGKGPDDLTPVVVFDLKGDLSLFHTVRIEAQRKRRDLQRMSPWTGDGPDPRVSLLPFHIRSGHASCGFNPLRDLAAHAPRPVELAEAIIAALGLFYGDRYGAGFYSKRHTGRLINLLHDEEKSGRLRSYADIAKLFEQAANEGGGKKNRDTEELVDSLEIVAQVTQLAAGYGKRTIHMPEVVQYGQIVYFFLPAITSPLSVRAVAKLAIYSLLEASRDFRERPGSPDPKRQTYVLIDEFQELAARNLGVIFQQARSAGLSLIVANQDPSALRLPDMDLKQTVYTNTRFKQFFTITDPREAQDLMLLSGEKIELQRQWSHTDSHGGSSSVYGGTSTWNVSDTVGAREIIRTELLPNEIRDVSNAQNDSLLWVLRDSGLTNLGGHFTRVTTEYTLPKEEYDRRARTPWPRAPDPVLEPKPVNTSSGGQDGDGRAVPEATTLAAVIQKAKQEAGQDSIPKPAKKKKKGKAAETGGNTP